MTAIPDPVRQQAEARPDAPAVVTETAVWSWADLDARVGACAARLAALDLGWPDATPGGLAAMPAVGVVAQTGPDLVVLLLAALRAGVVVVPCSPREPAWVARDRLQRLGVRAVVSDAAEPAGLGLSPFPPSDGRGSGTWTFYAGRQLIPPLRLADLATSADVETDAEAIPLDRPWTVVHTSGSTGEPKAALHTVGNHVWSARGVIERIGLAEGDRWLLDLPLWHVGGLGVVVRCALAGAAMAIPAPGGSVAEKVRRFGPTHASFVSTQLLRLLRDAPTEGFPGLRAVLLGGGAIAPGLLDAAVTAGLPVAVGYGMTEMASTVTMTGPGEGRDALATSGTLLPGRDLRVGASGEIEVRGETLFAGYAEADRLHRPTDAGGWFATGDLGRLDAQGRLVVEGRRDHRFVSGGENVQPEAVEAALARLPGVAEAVVVAVPDAEFGARPVAFVRPSGADAPTAEALRAGLRLVLPGFAVPVAFHAWAGPAGLKPDRRALADEAARRARSSSPPRPSSP